MKVADTILIELDQEAKTTKRVSGSDSGRQTLLETHTRKHSPWASWPCTLPHFRLAFLQQLSRTHGSPRVRQPEAKSRQEILDTFSEESGKCEGRPEENGRRPAQRHLELDQEWKVIMSSSANRFPSFHSYESQLSPSRATLGLSADPGCYRTVDLRPQCR